MVSQSGLSAMATTDVAQIDQDTLARKLRNCIAKFPVKARHLGREFAVRLNATADVIQVMDGGTLDSMRITVIAAKGDFADRPPISMEAFELLISGVWMEFQIRDVPDEFDPL